MGVAFLGSYLCISILEFKYKYNKIKYLIIFIYVFLYQNLNTLLNKVYFFNIEFMYFYIRI